MSAGPERKELKAQWEAEVDVLEYSLKDVAKHNTKNDVWVVIHGKGKTVRIGTLCLVKSN